MRDLRPNPWALAGFVAYAAGGLILGEIFPFSRFTMYADLAARDYGAVPVFLAAGEVADIHGYDRFYGLNPKRMHAPAGVVTSLDYVQDAMAAHVDKNRSPQKGPVVVEFGYDILRQRSGEISHELRITDKGTAWVAGAPAGMPQ